MQKEKLLVITPYRDREKHLSIFYPHLEKWLHNQKINYHIIISEQSQDNNWFNKGSIINCAFNEKGREYDYVCLHDIDMIPSCKKTCIYKYNKNPVHLASRVEQFKYKLHSKNYWGGVIMCTTQAFINANGFSNLYTGWGKEDIDFGVRLQKNKYKIKRLDGKYNSLQHEKHKWHKTKSLDKDMLNHNRELIRKTRTGEHNFRNDGLNTVKYKILSKDTISEHTTKITFELIK